MQDKTEKTVTREQIRTYIRPAWQPADEWIQTDEYNSMRLAHAAAVAREQRRKDVAVVRHSSGPARIIGKTAA